MVRDAWTCVVLCKHRRGGKPSAMLQVPQLWPARTMQRKKCAGTGRPCKYPGWGTGVWRREQACSRRAAQRSAPARAAAEAAQEFLRDNGVRGVKLVHRPRDDAHGFKGRGRAGRGRGRARALKWAALRNGNAIQAQARQRVGDGRARAVLRLQLRRRGTAGAAGKRRAALVTQFDAVRTPLFSGGM